MSKFPIIEDELGLVVHEYKPNKGHMETVVLQKIEHEHHCFVPAEPLERLFRQAPVVYGKWRPDGEHGWVTEEWSEKTDTHTARLIGVREIKKDSAEDLLRDLLEKFESGQGFDMSPYMNRAKKLLEEKK